MDEYLLSHLGGASVRSVAEFKSGWEYKITNVYFQATVALFAIKTLE